RPRCWACTAAAIPASRPSNSRRCTPHSRRRARVRSTSFTKPRSTASTRTIAPATTNRQRKTGGTGCSRGSGSICSKLRDLLLRYATEELELVVRSDRDQVGHAIRQREKSRDGADVPDVFVGESMSAQLVEVGVDELGGA